ncbi:ATP-dependent protease [Solemya pervernicosa gill symbiont]|uniref:endopeptidase La n=1 Tax=Solemya pervernicosa gill symbiont TaxID=642797 RepID=A0A1T2L719_9GAMM|nr:AAA family ATPase [Solemya pervernicosa gill symbiont]OOZ40834.1 ATP-dependent protease [Solemya pervernicosa gill symbiont]
MQPIKPLNSQQLCRLCDPDQFEFETTDELDGLKEIVGQSRAEEAVHFGIAIRREGYNIYALGPAGIGRHTLIQHFVEQQASNDRTPSDWCYVNNFKETHKPLALELPAGEGVELHREMDHLIEELLSAIPAAFEGEEYQNRVQEIQDALKERQESAFAELQQEAEQHQITLIRTPSGFAFAPTTEGEVIPPEKYEQLGQEEQARIEQIVSTLQEKLHHILNQIPLWNKEAREHTKQLNHEVTMTAVAHLIDALTIRFSNLPKVVTYLESVRDDLVENTEIFIKPDGKESKQPSNATANNQNSLFNRYRVNLLIDQSDSKGAPIIYNDNPSFQSMVGRVEHIAQMGALITDFTLIKPGALHQANGGYLILDIRKLLTEPYAWEGLKRALRAGEIKIESLGQMLSLISTVSLEPEPIPLDIKVILIGDRLLYYILLEYDPDFAELFKVAADFEEQIEATAENRLLYARLLGMLAHKEKLLPLHRSAVVRVIEYSARRSGDNEKLSTHARTLVDLLCEADHFATINNHSAINDSDIQQAIDAQIRRADRLREHSYEEINRGTLLIDTSGSKVGQVNALSVIDLGNFRFAQPTRITATTRLGEGEIIDIEREIELGGAIHSKGVMILTALLGERYGQKHPLSFSASLVFEQSYGGVEGDSASIAELCALLSSLANKPILQSLAVTGSVNQHGEVQAIGGVNEKIEGFFDICRGRGELDEHAVLIPASNVKHLMLRRDVVEAVENGSFQIYPIHTIDEAATLLMACDAGEMDDDEHYPEGSINQLVAERIESYATIRHEFGEKGKHDPEESEPQPPE